MHIVQLWYVWLIGLFACGGGGIAVLFSTFNGSSKHGSIKMAVPVFLFLASMIFGALLGLAMIGDVISTVAHAAH